MGQTPELRRHAGKERFSLITALTVSPLQKRYGMHFLAQYESFDTQTCKLFVEVLQERLRTPLLVLWDNLRAHHAAEKDFKATDRRPERIDFAYFPAYSPWLDPVEYFFAHLKTHQLAQFCPSSLHELCSVASKKLVQLRQQTHLIKACFEHASLVP